MNKFKVTSINKRMRNDWIITADAIPSLDDFIFEAAPSEDGHSTIFRGEAGDFVMFFGYAGPSFGYGGRTFYLQMKDGSRARLKGPWSSREGVVHNAFPLHMPVVEVVDHSHIAHFITINAVLRLGHHVKGTIRFDDELYYEIL